MPPGKPIMLIIMGSKGGMKPGSGGMGMGKAREGSGMPMVSVVTLPSPAVWRVVSV